MGHSRGRSILALVIAGAAGGLVLVGSEVIDSAQCAAPGRRASDEARGQAGQDHLADALSAFGRIAPGVFRSSQPTEAGLRAARAAGIRTLLVLRSAVPEQERVVADRLGLMIVHVPMDGRGLPTMKQVDRALEEIADPSNQPILVHCMHGEERTGAVAAAYRVTFQGWSPARAGEEARRLGFGFDGLEAFLSRYQKHRTTKSPGDRSAHGIAH